MDDEFAGPVTGGFQSAPPPLFVPFGTADGLRAQDLSNSLSKVAADRDSGEIDDATYRQAAGQLHAALGPLLARKQQTEDMEKQRSLHETLHQIALEQSVRQANAEHDAEGFNRRMAGYTDQLTGAHARFYQESPGKWKPVDFGNDSPMADLPAGEPAAEPSDAVDRSSTVSGDLENQRSVLGDGRMTDYVPPRVQENNDGTHTMVIENGQNREVVTFGRNAEGGWQTLGHQAFDKNGDPVKPQQQAEGAANLGGLSQSELQELHRRAEQSIPRPRFGPNPLLNAKMQQSWESQVSILARDMAVAENKRRQQQSGQAGTAAENMRKEKARAEAKKAAEDSYKERSRVFQHYEQQVMAEKVPEYDKNGLKVGDKWRYEGYTPEQIANEINVRVSRHNQHARPNEVYGDQHSPETAPEPPKATSAPPAAAAPPAPAEQPDANAVVRQQANRFDQLTGAFAGNNSGLTPDQRSHALGAVASLRTLVEKYGGDIRTAPADVRERAKQYAEVIRRYSPPRPTHSPALEANAQGFGM